MTTRNSADGAMLSHTATAIEVVFCVTLLTQLVLARTEPEPAVLSKDERRTEEGAVSAEWNAGVSSERSGSAIAASSTAGIFLRAARGGDFSGARRGGVDSDAASAGGSLHGMSCADATIGPAPTSAPRRN